MTESIDSPCPRNRLGEDCDCDASKIRPPASEEEPLARLVRTVGAWRDAVEGYRTAGAKMRAVAAPTSAAADFALALKRLGDAEYEVARAHQAVLSAERATVETGPKGGA